MAERGTGAPKIFPESLKKDLHNAQIAFEGLLSMILQTF